MLRITDVIRTCPYPQRAAQLVDRFGPRAQRYQDTRMTKQQNCGSIAAAPAPCYSCTRYFL
jgi:hypothetical protein